MNVIEVELKKIEQNENSRIVYKASDLSELMHSMKKDGLLQPVGVRILPNGKYDAVFGNRRIMAAKKLGWASISANVIEDLATDQDRDILNLLENLKRQNTTVAEDGRMFCSLEDHGLTPKEIAARLDISLDRVETAISVYKTIPESFHAKIVNRQLGAARKKPGTISASAAHQILNLKQKYRLNPSQASELLNYAAKEKTSIEHLNKIGPLMKKGMNLTQAMDVSSKLTRVTLNLFMSNKQVEKLERQYKTSINNLLMQQIEKSPKFVLYQKTANKYASKTSKHRNATHASLGA